MITHLYQSNTFLLFFFHTDCEASRKTKSKEKHFRPPQSGYGRNEERRPQGTKLRLIHTEFTVFDPKSEAPVLLQLVSFRTWTSSSKQSVTRTSAWPAVAGTPLRWASHFFFFIFLFFFQSFACVYSFVPSSHRQLHTLLSFLLQRFLDVVLTEQSKKTCFTYTSTNQKYAGAEPTAHRQTDRQQTAAHWLLRLVFYKNILVFLLISFWQEHTVLCAPWCHVIRSGWYNWVCSNPCLNLYLCTRYMNNSYYRQHDVAFLSDCRLSACISVQKSQWLVGTSQLLCTSVWRLVMIQTKRLLPGETVTVATHTVHTGDRTIAQSKCVQWLGNVSLTLWGCVITVGEKNQLVETLLTW